MYRQKLTLNTFRFHDAFIVKEADITDNKLVLSNEILTPKVKKEDFLSPDFDVEKNRKIQFHIKYYNSSKIIYKGPVARVPLKSNQDVTTDYNAFKIAS